MRPLLMSALLGMLVAVFAGPAAASHTGLLFGAPARVNVEMGEWFFKPAKITVDAGVAVDIVLENKGSLAHTFMVYPKPATPPKGVGDWYEYVLRRTYFQDIGEIIVHRRGEFVITATRIAEVAVEPGKKVTLTFTPTRKGTVEIACQLSTGGGGSHAQAGMVGTLIVK
jgi:uncharacterized cupredoxin-like copper-binding protein